jgi:hypothetical protein
VRKKCSTEKLLKFEDEGQDFAKFLRSIERFIQAGKGQNNFWLNTVELGNKDFGCPKIVP